MEKIAGVTERYILNRLKILPDNKKVELLDFLEFLLNKVNEEANEPKVEVSSLAVEETWGSIKLNKKNLKYIAEDKGLEYEF